MNAIANKVLLAGDKFMPEMHLEQQGFICSAYGPFTKNKGRTVKNQRNRRFKLNQKKLDKGCFLHDMADGDFKDLNRRTAANKVLLHKAFNFTEIQKMVDINMDLLQCFIIF